MIADDDRGKARERLVEELHALRAENAILREQNASLTAVIDFIGDAVYVKDASSRYLMINRESARLIGRPVEEIVGKDDADLFPADIARRIGEFDRKVVADGKARTYEEPDPCGGMARWYLTTKGPYRDDDGCVQGVIGISRDITERKRTDDAFHETREFLTRLLDNAPAIIYVTGSDGRLRLVNRAWEELFHLPRKDVIGRLLDEFCPDELAQRFLAQNKTVIDTAAPIAIEESFDAADGRHVLYTVKFPLHNADDQIESVGGISFDITERKRTEEALDDVRHRLQALFDNALDGIVLLDDDGHYVSANPAACAILGYSADELARITFRDVIPLENVETSQKRWVDFLANGKLNGDFTAVRKDGSRRKAEYRAVAHILPGLHLAMVRDVTEQIRALEEHKQQNELLQTIFDHIPIMINLFDQNGRMCLVNREWERVLGWSLNEADHDDVFAEFYPNQADRDAVLSATREPVPRWSDFRTTVRDGRLLDTSWTTIRLTDGSTIGIGQDITDRKQAEEALRDYAERLQFLSRRVVEVQEEERRHLARELHDEVGQSLTAIGITLQATKKVCGGPMQHQIEDCIDIVDRTIDQVRRLSLDLRPSMLDDLGLVAALRWYLDRQAQRVGYRAHFEANPSDVRLNSTVATTAFRVAQEALTNIARHAGARRVWVKLELRASALRLAVHDDGSGFDRELASHRGSAGESLGLLGMRERAALLGGGVAIRSTPGRGTLVRLTIPVKPNGA